MKKDLFIEHVRRKGTLILGGEPKIKFDTNVKDFHSLKSLFEYVDFDCQHNEDGGCKELSESRMCCCHDCFDRGGFFRVLIGDDITYYSRKFNVREKTGFWRKGKGCILPHKMRSVICLTHFCRDNIHSKKDKRPDFGHGIRILKELLIELRRRI